MTGNPAISPLSELGGLSRLAEAAARRDPTAVDAVARRFEALFAEMMVSSMRSASMGDPLFEGQNTMYREFYDRELASSMTAGKGLGIADMLRRQLAPAGTAPTPPAGTGLPLAPAGKAMALPTAVAAPALPLPTSAMLPAQPLPPATQGKASAGTAIPVASVLSAKLPALPAVPSWFPDPQLAALGEICAPTSNPMSPALDLAGFVPIAPTTNTAVPAHLANARPGTPEAFVAEVWPHAQAAAAELGVDPRMLVAQAALETGWGRSTMRGADGAASHNVFGVKATGGWQGAAVSQATLEFRDGVMQRERAAFRAYGSVGESFADYVRLVKDNPRYSDALAAGTDGGRFADALARAGYATDPQYAAKLKAIADGPTLRRALAQLPLATTQEA
jgi:flagellar protein FlgJ